MERLTQWIDENRAIPRVDLRRCGHERCTTQLAGVRGHRPHPGADHRAEGAGYGEASETD